MRKEKLLTLLFCFTLLFLGCRKENEEIYQVRKIDEARAMYNKSQEQLGMNTLFKQNGLSVDWDSYREVNDSTFVVSTTQIAEGNKGSKIIGNFELYFDLRNKSEGKGYIRYTLPWKERGRADYIAYSFQGRVIMPKKSINRGQLIFKGSNSYYKTVVYAIKQNCPQGLYFNLINCFCNYPEFIIGDTTPTYWVVQFEDEPFVSYFLAPLDGASSGGEDADVVAFPDYNWSGNDGFDPYRIINPNYDPNGGTGGTPGGGGSGTGSPGGNTGGGSGSSSASSFNNRIDDSGLPECMRDIIDILNSQQGNSIGDILKKLDGDVPGYNWKISGDPTMGNMQYGKVEFPYNSSQQTVVGYINTSTTVMSEISELKMAATLAHEAIHAYLVNELNSAPGSVEKTYPELFKDLMKRKSTSSAQHIIMINNYVDDIAASVKFYALTMGYSSAIDEQVYKDIAWTGLVDMAEFNTAVPNINDRERIRNRIKAESSGQPFGGMYPVGDKLSLRCK